MHLSTISMHCPYNIYRTVRVQPNREIPPSSFSFATRRCLYHLIFFIIRPGTGWIITEFCPSTNGDWHSRDCSQMLQINFFFFFRVVESCTRAHHTRLGEVLDRIYKIIKRRVHVDGVKLVFSTTTWKNNQKLSGYTVGSSGAMPINQTHKKCNCSNRKFSDKT